MHRKFRYFVNLQFWCSLLVCVALIPPLLLEHFSSTPAFSEIFSYVDSNGKTHLTNRQVYSSKKSVRSSASGKYKVDKNNLYAREMEHYAALFSVPVALVQAVMKVESNFNPFTVSRKGAMGLMQLMPDTAKEMGVRNAFLPKENIRGGTKYLGSMIKRHRNLSVALAAYNAGPGAVKKFKGVPPYRETRNYIKRVKSYYKKYSLDSRLGSSTARSSTRTRKKPMMIKEVDGKFLYVVNSPK